MQILEILWTAWPLLVSAVAILAFVYWCRKRALDNIEWYNKRIEQQGVYHDSYTFRTSNTERLRILDGDGGARASPGSSGEEPDGDDWVH
jgi:hypothetical protein